MLRSLGLLLLTLCLVAPSGGLHFRRKGRGGENGKTRMQEILQRHELSSLKAPWHGSGWYSASSDKEVCDYLCKSQCLSATDIWAPPVCENCRNSCMSFQICDKEGGSEDCLTDKACSMFAYGKQIVKGIHPDGTAAYEFCGKYPGDGTCRSCKNCVAEQCHFEPGGADCGGPWGDCCMQRCLGAKPYPR